MKLYATVTSERATKGQGGKELDIDITDEIKSILWTLEVRIIEGVYSLKVARGSDHFHSHVWFDTLEYTNKTNKGEKKKGEKCVHCRTHHENGGCNPF